MTRLDCSVTNCHYNEDRCCCKSDIVVDGKDATRAKGTCCASFREKRGTSARNAFNAPDKNTEIECHVCNCLHNEDCKCAADHIGIGGSSACQCGETECMTFCCK